MHTQQVLNADANYQVLDRYLVKNNVKSVLLVCDNSLNVLNIGNYFSTLTERTGIKIIMFTDFMPNPLYESVVKGVQVFNENNCDLIIAVGGGSAIDVAKCIKLFSSMNSAKNYLKQTIFPNDVKLMAVPTTAGTGSEATRYAVIYYNGEKQSISDYSCIPSAVLMDSSALKTLPEYQKKSTMMDAMCHAVESFWSVNSTDESKKFSIAAIQLILANKDAYLKNEDTVNANMLYASNLAGKAINITQTTAGHAMCYKLTSLYGIAHGHAAALCVNALWSYMVSHTELCIDSRGEVYLRNTFSEIAAAFGCSSAEAAAERFNALLISLDFHKPQPNEINYEVLKKSVNLVRLKNNPVQLDENAVDKIYHQIFTRSDTFL